MNTDPIDVLLDWLNARPAAVREPLVISIGRLAGLGSKKEFIDIYEWLNDVSLKKWEKVGRLLLCRGACDLQLNQFRENVRLWNDEQLKHVDDASVDKERRASINRSIAMSGDDGLWIAASETWAALRECSLSESREALFLVS
jgi:hypothetical protein